LLSSNEASFSLTFNESMFNRSGHTNVFYIQTFVLLSSFGTERQEEAFMDFGFGFNRAL